MKMYGGEVHSIGFALVFFLPAYFTDTLDSELFDSKWHRLWVNLSGIYIELLMCVLATGIWLVSYPDTFIHHFAYMGMIYTGISTIFFNLNPMTPNDGYHALEDIIEIPNLRPNRTRTWARSFKNTFFDCPSKSPSSRSGNGGFSSSMGLWRPSTWAPSCSRSAR